MSEFNWDENITEQDDDFIAVDNIQEHNREVQLCMLNDPDCDACQ
ncbi:MAG: hypothetical protein AAF975_00985 [Spirochaetota bacterium]